LYDTHNLTQLQAQLLSHPRSRSPNHFSLSRSLDTDDNKPVFSDKFPQRMKCLKAEGQNELKHKKAHKKQYRISSGSLLEPVAKQQKSQEM